MSLSDMIFKRHEVLKLDDNNNIVNGDVIAACLFMLIRSCCVASLYLFKNIPLLRIFGFVKFTVSLNGVVGILQMNVKIRALEVKRMCDDYTYLV